MSNSKTSSGFKNSKVDPVTSQRAQLYALVDAALEAGADASELASTLASLASSSEPSLSSSSSKVAPAPLAETQQQEQQQTIRGAAVPGGDRINSSKVHFGGGDEHELREAARTLRESELGFHGGSINSSKKKRLYSEAWKILVDPVSTLPSSKRSASSEVGKKRHKSIVVGELKRELKKRGGDFINMVQRSAKWEAEFVPLDWIAKHLIVRPKEEGGAETTTVTVRELAEFLKGVAIKVKPLLSLAKAGLAVRLAFSLVATYSDLITDVLLIGNYFFIGQEVYAYVTLVFVILNHLGQAFVSIYLNKQEFLDLVYVFTGVKPVVDVIRLLSGTESSLDRVEVAYNPALVLLGTKIAEVFLESYPAIIVQLLFIIMTNEAPSPLQSLSLFASCFSAAFGIACADIDADTAAASRKDWPHFHGFVPDDFVSEAFFFGVLTVAYFFFSISRAVTVCAVIVSFGIPAFAIWYLVEIVIYYIFVQGLGRGHWIDVSSESEGVTSFLLSFFMNGVVNYCGSVGILPVLELRDPFNCGGLTWSISVLYSLVSNLAIVGVISAHSKSEAGKSPWKDKVSPDTIFALLAVSTVLCLVFASLSYCMMKEGKPKQSFFSSRTSKVELMYMWKNGGVQGKPYWRGVRLSRNFYRAILLQHYGTRNFEAADVRDWIIKNRDSWNTKPPKYWLDVVWRTKAAKAAGMKSEQELLYNRKGARRSQMEAGLAEAKKAAQKERETSMKASRAELDLILSMSAANS